MSLEQALAENTATLKLVLAALQAGALVPAGAAQTAVATAAAETTAPKATRARKPAAETPAASTTPTAAATTNDGKREMPNRLVDDPQGTLYFHIAKHNTVAKVLPGEVIPSIEGIEECSGTQYQNWKSHYAAQVPSSGAAPTGGSAAAPASSTPAAGPASSQASAPSQPASTGDAPLDAKALTAKCQELHKAQGNDGLLDVLKHFGVTRVPDLVSKADKAAEIAAYIDAKLAPAGENLFG